MRFPWRLIGLLITVSSLYIAIRWWQSPAPFTSANLLPATTAVYLQFPNVQAAAAHWQQTPAATLTARLNAGSVANSTTSLFSPHWIRLFDEIQRGVVQFGDGELFVAMTGLQTTPRILPLLAVGIQLGPRHAEAKQWADQLQTVLARQYPRADFGHQRYFARNYRYWQLQPGLEICLINLDEKWLVLTLGKAPMLEIIDRYRDPARDCLCDTIAFKSARARLPKNIDCRLVIQSAALLRTADPFLQWLPQLKSLTEPLKQVASIGMTESFQTNQVHEALVVVHEQAPAVAPVPQTLAVAGNLPASCTAFASADLSPADLYQAATQLTAATGQKEWMDALALFESFWTVHQIDFSKEILKNLHSPTLIALDWPADQPSANLVIGTGLNQAAAVSAQLERTAMATELPLPWRITNNWLWISTSAAALERIDQAGRHTLPTLQARLDQLAIADRVSGKAWGWVYTDTSRLAGRTDLPALTHTLTANLTHRGNADLLTIDSPLGSLMNAWITLESMGHQPALKKNTAMGTE